MPKNKKIKSHFTFQSSSRGGIQQQQQSQAQQQTHAQQQMEEQDQQNE